MKIKVPSKVQVGGHWYAIKFDPDIKDDGYHGTTNYRKQEIALNPERPGSQMEETLVHEFLHVADEVYCNHKATEELIDSLSQGLYQVLKQLDIEFDFSEIKE